MTIDESLSESAKVAGMDAAEDHAETAYKNAVVEVIRTVAMRQATISSDDVAQGMQTIFPLLGTHDRRVIGPMFKRAQKMRYCEPLVCAHCQSVVTRRSKWVSAHANPMNIWKSLLYPAQ